jgi:hypothetical protein
MDGWIAFGAAIVGAIVGGAITGYSTLRGVEKSYQNAVELQKKKEQAIIQGLLQALHDEVETIWERYMEGVGFHLEALKENQPLILYYPVVQDYFTVYNSNTFLIGHIADNDLRKDIVFLYTTAKGLVDSYRLNNDLVQKFEYWNNLFIETQNEVHKDRAAAQFGVLVEYAKIIKKQHDILKQKSSELLRKLRKSGVLSEKNS